MSNLAAIMLFGGIATFVIIYGTFWCYYKLLDILTNCNFCNDDQDNALDV